MDQQNHQKQVYGKTQFVVVYILLLFINILVYFYVDNKTVDSSLLGPLGLIVFLLLAFIFYFKTKRKFTSYVFLCLANWDLAAVSKDYHILGSWYFIGVTVLGIWGLYLLFSQQKLS